MTNKVKDSAEKENISILRYTCIKASQVTKLKIHTIALLNELELYRYPAQNIVL